MTTSNDDASTPPSRKVLVTGATSGIGAATSVAFAKTGAHVLVSGRDRTRGEQTCDAVRAAGGEATLLLADLTDPGSVDGLARGAIEHAGGHIDVLVNCAGGGSFKPTQDVTAKDFDSIYGLNVRAPYFLTAAIAPIMARRGAGAIVNVASIGTKFGMAGLSLFSSAKAALDAMTLNWAAEYGPSGVRVNGIDVGAVETPVNLHLRDAIAQMVSTIPARRMGVADEVANVIVFLASPAASYIHGVVLPVDGGMVIS